MSDLYKNSNASLLLKSYFCSFFLHFLKLRLLHLIDYMLNNQNTDPSVDYLMKNSRLHVMPSMNPDGLQRSSVGDCDSVVGRANANNYDLNRNFPDFFQCNTDRIQPETHSVINWLENNQFVISANFHGGSVVKIFFK
jgi:murein tripeptide amidase MpaA